MARGFPEPPEARRQRGDGRRRGLRRRGDVELQASVGRVVVRGRRVSPLTAVGADGDGASGDRREPEAAVEARAAEPIFNPAPELLLRRGSRSVGPGGPRRGDGAVLGGRMGATLPRPRPRRRRPGRRPGPPGAGAFGGGGGDHQGRRRVALRRRRREGVDRRKSALGGRQKGTRTVGDPESRRRPPRQAQGPPPRGHLPGARAGLPFPGRRLLSPLGASARPAATAADLASQGRTARDGRLGHLPGVDAHMVPAPRQGRRRQGPENSPEAPRRRTVLLPLSRRRPRRVRRPRSPRSALGMLLLPLRPRHRRPPRSLPPPAHGPHRRPPEATRPRRQGRRGPPTTQPTQSPHLFFF
mmetsp:Transcript_32700/g.104243  ORF Transcript_32700/g.104243 Transcript_32700/m.104243 type:complete len:356 (+) Transcript_32700:262-1329(+)